MSVSKAKTLEELFDDNETTTKTRSGFAATIGGDQVVTKEEKGEVYIRADGKKVRKIKKTVIKKKKKSTETTTSDDNNTSSNTPLDDDETSPIKSAINNPNGTVDNDDNDDNGSVVSYMSQGVKKKKKKIKKTQSIVSQAAAVAASAEAANLTAENITVTDNMADSDDDNMSYVSTSGTKRKGKKGKKKKTLLSDAATVAAEAEVIGKVDDSGALATSSGQINNEIQIGNLNKTKDDDDDDGSVVSYMSASGTKRKKKKKKKKIDNTTSAEAIAAAAESAIADDDQSVVSYMSASGTKRKKKKGTKGRLDLEGFLNQGPPPSTKALSIDSKQDLKNIEKSEPTLEASAPAVLLSTVTSGEGEIYINKDGKKVRRVRKGKSKSTDDIPQASLSGILDVNNRNTQRTGPATVAGDHVSTIESTSEVYINKDGKKVRRVKKTVTRVKPKEEYVNNNGELANMLESGTASADKSAPATISGPTGSSSTASEAQVGEIYINEDGKKVRRIRRTVSKSAIDTSSGSLGQMLDNDNRKVVGSATVAGGVETEIYIRADGKKVRRVKRSPSGTVGSSATSLAGLSSVGAGSTAVGSMSVGGDTISEIYINKDGKKVRRIRKAPVGAVITPDKATDGSSDVSTIASTSKAEDTASLAGRGATTPAAVASLARLDDLRGVDGNAPKMVGAATVAAPTKTTVESEIYINKDGKKVRRIRKTTTSATSVAGDLNSLLASTSKPGASGGATVGGDRPTLSASSDEGEIYIRADGKKVRRIRKPSAAATAPTASSDANQSLQGFLHNDQLPKPRLMDSATVAGDKLSTKLDGGEIILRADGKKVIRRVKKKEQESEQDSEVYRRADGKLVRRVKKDTKVAAKPAVPTIELTAEEEKIAVEYRKLKKMGLPDDAVRHKMTVTKVHPKVVAAVMGDKWTDPASIPEAPKLTPVENDILGSSLHLNLSTHLTGGEEALAKQFRKLKSLGLPDDAVRHKMVTAKVDPKIIAAVFDEVWTPKPNDSIVESPALTMEVDGTQQTKSEASDIVLAIVPQSTSTLTPEEQEAVDEFRKLKRFGLSDEALRRRMELNEVDPKIISVVLGATSANASPAKTPIPMATKEDTGEIEIKIVAPLIHGETVVEDFKDSQNDSMDDIILRAPQSILSTPDKPELLPGEKKRFAGQLTEDEEAIAAQFKKMQKMGLPDDAVRHKMLSTETSPKIIAYVFDEEWADPCVNEAKVGKEETDSLPSVQLTDEEEEIAAEFKKMQKMGLPNEVVRHKMTAMDVHPKIVAAVLGEIWTDSTLTKAPLQVIPLGEEEEAIATEFKRMQKLGLPKEVVQHKMIAMDVNPKIIAAVLGEEWTESEALPSTSKDDTFHHPTDQSSDNGEVIASLKENVVEHEIQPTTMATVLDKEEAISPSHTVGAHQPILQLSEDEEEIAVQFRNMQKVGLPNEVVRHKMTTMNIHPKIVASVMGEEWSDQSAAQGTSPGTSEPAFQLNEDEEAIAGQYRKMQKMGLHNDVVRHKMASMDIHPKIVAAVLGEPWNEPVGANGEEGRSPTEAPVASFIQLDDTEEAIALQFRKMQKMGLPNDAVQQKMVSMSINPRIIAAVLGEPWNEAVASGPPLQSSATSTVQLNDDEDEIAEQFRKMQKMGLPNEVVRHKMTSMDIPGKIIAAVLGEPWIDPSSKSNEGASSPTPASLSIQLDEGEEAIAEQFRKMQKMGLPNDVVRHKMTTMDIHPKIVAAVLGEPWNDPAVSSATALSSPEGEITPAAFPTGTYLVVEDDFKLNPDETFAVKIAEGASNGSPKTKFVTLAELARMSGQSRTELESIVREKKKRSTSPPRFVIQTIAEEKFEVEMPENARGSGGGGRSGTGGPVVNGGVQIKEGEEVVNSSLANTARAVSALGDGDLSELIAKLQSGDMAELLARLREAEKRQKKLEKQLQQAGVAIAEDIDYVEAKSKVEQIAKRMNEIGGSDVVVADKEEQNRLREEYFKLEQEMERYNTALMLSEEYQQEQDRLAKKWETDNEQDNIEALKRIRRHMPVMIRHMSEADLVNKPSPNGKYLSKNLAKKFKRTNVLQCLRINPLDLERMHPCTLENMRVTGLTLTERRAVYMHLRPLGPKWEKNKAEKMTERKWTWFQMMKNNFKENLDPYLRHCAQYGPSDNHPFATRDNPNVGCPLMGKQCPVRADKEFDYSGDYGYPEGDEYEVSDVKKSDVDDPGAKAKAEAAELAREKKANERADILKKHYKGKLLQVSKANGSCESMDEAMDKMENHTLKWIEFMLAKGKDETEDDKKKEIANFTEALNELKLSSLELANRSGMQTSGKKKAGGDAPDIRSSVEASLAEETFECVKELFAFVKDRMAEIKMVDTRVEKTIEMLDAMWTELHGKNVTLLETLGIKRTSRSRKLKKNADLRKEVEERQKPEEPEPEPEAPPRLPMGGGGRGGLLDAIGGRGRGGAEGGRGGLLDAIAGRGRGRGRGGGGGRGGLLDAIAGRGRGGKGGDTGGRGGLLDAIKGKGKGDGGGGRGDLLSAIAGRGRGGGGDPGGGRGGLLAAIAARGGGG